MHSKNTKKNIKRRDNKLRQKKEERMTKKKIQPLTTFTKEKGKHKFILSKTKEPLRDFMSSFFI